MVQGEAIFYVKSKQSFFCLFVLPLYVLAELPPSSEVSLGGVRDSSLSRHPPAVCLPLQDAAPGVDSLVQVHRFRAPSPYFSRLLHPMLACWPPSDTSRRYVKVGQTEPLFEQKKHTNL